MDSVKEFGIRVKDGSDSSKKAFADLGLDADEMIKQFSSGGKEAQKAFKQVNKALADCDDKVLQNSVGVALYGTNIVPRYIVIYICNRVKSVKSKLLKNNMIIPR